MIEALLTFDFIRYSFISGLIVGLIAPLLGAFIVVRRLSLIADALSHISLGGITFGLYITSITGFVINPLISGIVFSILGALGIEKMRTAYKNFSEISIPIIMSLGIALSVIFLSLSNGFNQDLFGYLFGSISAVTLGDLILIAIIGIVVVTFIILLYKEMFLLSFDEEYSEVMKINRFIHIIFIILVALVISASMRIVGILLVSAMMTLPVAAAIRITSSFKQLIFVSILFGELSVIIGLFLGFQLNISPGGTIVLVAIMILTLTFLVKKIGVSQSDRAREL
ncbi:metal ABC transporter permease [Phocicoccus pinnipedialis]|uniref:High-affinity zinc uptake system membrane protein ZnuB n=1 Tax=Phocicoccus pinnipedialis TaxID=110845 RepID=A0A6V7RF08_9BACL|nr:metal ABC transporter permease [Jeotgalicoccus pinnipedialis]MBP1939285.1 zinc transport system permease protein [Jeotgalicoccus pinnipedialis]CAD2076032.1 High-affinity zinc uptake system membrane protein ZnuB [Jeotgalicoccus pinnipedialis]